MMRHAGGLAGFLPALALVLAVSVAGAQGNPDLKQALKPVRAAWRDYTPCWLAHLCDSYFDSFGVGILFADGSARPFEHLQRLTASAHDCIENARESLARGDRGLAVQWVMASQRSPAVRDWMRLHPDTVIEVLQRCCS